MQHQSSGGRGAKEGDGQEPGVGEGIISFGAEQWKILHVVVQDDPVSGLLTYN